jgi:hypothetical protein
MRRFKLSLFIVLFCAVQAEAEPTSIRCEPKYFEQHPQPYFVVYDLETKHFLFERPGGNKLLGEIIAVNDAQLDFRLSVDGGDTLLYFNRKRNVMTWPGMPANEMGRSLLQHACTDVPGRTMLSAFYRSEPFDPKRLDPVDAFSLTCTGEMRAYFVTLDRATKIVVLETYEAGRTMSGEITGTDDGVMKFAVTRGPDQFDLVWDERKRLLTWIGVVGNQSRPTKTHECAVTKPRSIMEGYPSQAR